MHDVGKAFVLGCGYLGRRVARRLISRGWSVSALTRSERKAGELRGLGIQPIVGDWLDSRVSTVIPEVDRVLIAVGFDGRSGASRREVYVDGLRNALRGVSPASSVVYVSTTGVYHQGGNAWVDEFSPTRPSREGGKAHLQAEELLRRERATVGAEKTIVLRMAGLYGPGRIPNLAAIERGEPIVADGESFLNLIHIEDAADAVVAAWDHAIRESRYVISDGSPVLRREYYQEIARLIGAPSPELIGDRAGRSEGSKRIWTRRMRRDLLSRLRYPSYREGLRALCQSGGKA